MDRHVSTEIHELLAASLKHPEIQASMRERLLVARSWRHEDEVGKYDSGLHAQISGTYAQIQASTIQVMLMLLLAIDDWRFGESVGHPCP
jgi:hypothetical protein